MREGLGAVASGAAGIGLSVLTWGLDRMGIEIPYGVALAVSIAGALLLLLSFALVGHMMWRWVGARKDAIRSQWTQYRRQYSNGFGLLLIGICVGWLTGGQLPTFWHFSQNTGPIVWNFDETASGHGYFLDMQKGFGQETKIIGFGAVGKNISSNPIEDFEGYIRSDVTNEKFPLYVMAANPGAANACVLTVPTPPKETLGIPAFSSFWTVTHKSAVFVNVPYSGAIPAAKFKNEFVPFTVVVEYGGKQYTHHFSRPEVDRQLAIFEKASGPPTQPYVVRKNSTAPLSAFPPLTPLIKADPWHPPANPDFTGTVLEK